MKYSKFSVLVVSVLLIAGTMFAGCGGSSDNPDPLAIIGTWLVWANGYEVLCPITVNITAHTAAGAGGVVASATPGGGDPAYITGITITTDGAPGVEEPRGLTIRITFNDGSWVQLNGEVNDDNDGMSGTYINSTTQTDSWNASRQQ